MLECVQRIVVNEDRDRTLSREEVRRMIDRVAKSILPSRWGGIARFVIYGMVLVHNIQWTR